MSDDLETVLSQASAGDVTTSDVRKRLRDQKDKTKTDIHTIMMWVLLGVASALAIGLTACALSYFCYIIRGVAVPTPLSLFLANVVEWILISGASFFAALKVRDFCE